RADLVHGLRWDLARDPRLDLRLAGGDLALTGLKHLPVDDHLDPVGLDLGTLKGALDRLGAEVDGVERGERAAHLGERRPGGAEDDCSGHLSLSLSSSSATGGRAA